MWIVTIIAKLFILFVYWLNHDKDSYYAKVCALIDAKGYNTDDGLEKLKKKIIQWVKEKTKGRDKSHGFDHMHIVALNTEKITKYYDDNDYNIICMIVAYLHDVADHKYDKDGKLNNKVLNFLTELFDSHTALWLNKIILCISFSKEKKIRDSGKDPIDFWKKKLGKNGCIIRNIVSDADKIEALGQTGFDRCIEYSKEFYKHKYGRTIPKEILAQLVIKHSNEKLLKLLPDYYIRTPIGREIAKEKDQELRELIKIL